MYVLGLEWKVRVTRGTRLVSVGLNNHQEVAEVGDNKSL